MSFIALIIDKQGTVLHSHPDFKPHCQDTQRFASDANKIIRHKGIALSMGDDVSIQAIDIAIEVLDGLRNEQIKSEVTYGRIEEEG
jgi:hypothetical protein